MAEVKGKAVEPMFSRNDETNKHLMSTLTADERKALGMVDEVPEDTDNSNKEKQTDEKPKEEKPADKPEAKPEETAEVKTEDKKPKVDTTKDFDEVFKIGKPKPTDNAAPLTEDERAEYLKLKTETETKRETDAINSRLGNYAPEEAEVINEGLAAVISSDLYGKFNGLDADEKAYVLVALAEKRMSSNIVKVREKLTAAKQAEIEKAAKAKAQAEVEVKAIGTAETTGKEADGAGETERKKWAKARKGDKQSLDELIAAVKPING